jgi:hypothetical protein
MLKLNIKMLDIVCCLGIFISLNLVKTWNVTWLVYSCFNLGYLYLGFKKKLYGLAIMSGLMTITAIINYFRG